VLNSGSANTCRLLRCLSDLSDSEIRQASMSRPRPLGEPLTSSERKAITERIRKEVTDMAVEVLQREQETKTKLSSVHLKCLTLILLATLAVGFAMYYLRAMILPFILAVFFMFLLEPVLFILIEPRYVLKLCQRRPRPTHRDAQASDQDGGEAFSCQAQARGIVGSSSWKLWVIFCVTLCVLFLVVVVGIVTFYGVQAVTSVDWSKYSTSHNWKLLIEWFPQLSTDDNTLRGEKVIQWVLQGTLYSALDMALSVITGGFLFLLFLVFLLFNDAMAVEETPTDLWMKVRVSVRSYIRIKTVAALVVAVLCGTLYALLKVDLWFLFAVCTFLLCYVPHVGNTVAVLAPLPIVFLDPGKTLSDLVMCFAMPFTIHQLTANLIEPKLLASSLDLHPVVVLMSLGFWASLWGAVGAVLSVPLTAVLRMILLESAHPYAMPIAQLFKIEPPKRRLKSRKSSKKPEDQGKALSASMQGRPGQTSPAPPGCQGQKSTVSDPSPCVLNLPVARSPLRDTSAPRRNFAVLSTGSSADRWPEDAERDHYTPSWGTIPD